VTSARSSEELVDQAAPFQWGLPALALAASAAFALSGAGSQTVWYVVRATGVVSYVLITLTVVCGLLVSMRALPAGRSRVDVYEVHRFLALLAICGASFHALSLLLDSYIGFSPSQILIPLTSSYRPVAVSLGIMALYGSMAVYASFYAKRWLGYRTWRALHYGSFAVFSLATYHGILSGADTGQAWMLAVYFGSIGSVLGLLIFRIIKVTEAEAAKEARPAGAGGARPPATTPVAQALVGDSAWRPPLSKS
jgi:sulfoxide reductase heme-binding subunit YedZ